MSSPHYCIWGLCKPQQYCCGDNLCCDPIHVDSLFVTGSMFITIVLAIYCICYCFMCQDHALQLKKYFKIIYILMFKRRKNETNAARTEEPIMEDCVVQIEKTKTML